MSPPPDLESVLEEDDWLRRMARQLVGDSHASEDLAQDAWVTALTRGRTDRPCLFGVLRNLRRETVRRAVRDDDLTATASLPTDAPPADDVVAELLLRKQVTEQLLELEEPYRTFIFLRFVQDEKLPAIARRTGLSVSTAHQRIARGLELMRMSLDEHYGGTRKTWALGILSLAKPPGIAATVFGGFILGTSAKVVATLVLLGGTLAVVWNGSDDREAHSRASIAPVKSEVAIADQVEPLVKTPAASLRSEIVIAPEEAKAVDVVATSEASVLSGWVIDMDGLSVADVSIGLAEANQRGRADPTVADANGQFELTVTGLDDSDPSIECLDERFVTLLHGIPSGSEYFVFVGRNADFAGIVVDEDDQPIANANLRFDIRQSLFREFSIPRPYTWSSRSSFARSQKSDELGRFDFPRSSGGKHLALWVRANGYESQTVYLPTSGDSALRIVLTPQADERIIKGFVLDQMGIPAPGASVAAGKTIVLSDESGAFVLAVNVGEPTEMISDGDGVYAPKYDASNLRAALAGYLPAELPIEEIEFGEEVILRLGSPTLEISGRVVDEDGMPRPGVIVWVANLAAFGFKTHETGESLASWSVSIEEVNNNDNHGCTAETDDLGFFKLKGLTNRDYELRAIDSVTGSHATPITVAAGTMNCEYLFANEPLTMRVAGQIQTLSGSPIEGVRNVPSRGLMFGLGATHSLTPNVIQGTHSDAEGRFEFESLATSETVLQLQHDSFFIEQFALSEQDDLDDLVIVQPVLCEVEVELDWSPGEHNMVQILDENELPLSLIKSHGAFVGMGDFVMVTDGKTGIFQVNETARIAVYKKDGDEVVRKIIRVDPTDRTLIRL
ncbi:MAG: DNA-directed RNA polymerase specialized sigma24 family protein [Planctomycetota bacterium]|jgi:DNA-directed RNA polymerase specialized sigma24 family protein